MIELIVLLASLPVITVTIVMLLEVSLGGAPARPEPSSDRDENAAGNGPRPTAIIIPAHDEELVIGATLERILSEGQSARRVLVVADNCNDATAKIARAAGAEVIERVDDARRGKGYALAFARAHLVEQAPECVAIIDADTLPAPGALDHLLGLAARADRPVQAAYTIEPVAGATPMARFSAIAFYMKNVVRQLGLSRIGAPVVLTGSGMAFPWRIFQSLPLETGHVTEDLMLGVSCSLAGDPPVFLAAARVQGGSSPDGGTGTQRRRWESGFVATAKAYVPRLILAGIRTPRPGLIWLALHLATPPLLLLLALDTLMLVVLGALAIIAGVKIAFILLLSLTVALVVALIAATARHGQRLTLSDLGSVPGYIAWKLVLSVRTLLKRETSWIRTSRE